MCKKNIKNEIAFKFYHSNRRIVLWSICILIVFGACIVGFPGFIVFWDNVVLPKIYIGNFFDNDNFLSGLIGIILGFLFDLILINKIRRILKYKSLVNTLTREFNKILKAIFNEEYTDEISVFWNRIFVFRENGNEEKELCLKSEYDTVICKFSNKVPKQIFTHQVLKSIIISADYDFVFLKLNSVLHENLHEINAFINRFNDEFCLHPTERPDYLKLLVEKLGLFYILTNKNIYKSI